MRQFMKVYDICSKTAVNNYRINGWILTLQYRLSNNYHFPVVFCKQSIPNLDLLLRTLKYLFGRNHDKNAVIDTVKVS